jgi:hypothetical protein
MKFLWLWIIPVFGFSPVMVRYLRIQTNTNTFWKEMYSHTAGKVVSSLISIEGPFKEVIQGTAYECVEKKTFGAEDVAKHLLIQLVSYEVNQGVHEIVNQGVQVVNQGVQAVNKITVHV